MVFGDFVVKNRFLIFLVFVVVSVILGYYGIANLTINSDLASLAPKEADFYVDQIDFLVEKLSSNTLTVIAYTNGDVERTKAALEKLKERFEQTEYIVETMKLDNPEIFIKYGFLAIDSNSLKDISNSFNLNSSNLLDFSEYRKLAQSFATVEQLLEEYEKRKGIEQFIMVSPDQRVIIINFVLRDNIIDVNRVSRAIMNLKKIAQQVSKETNVKFLFTGTAVGVFESNEQVQKDFLLTTAISFAGICLVIYLGYRSIPILGLLLVSMIVAMCTTLGITKFFLGEINIVTSFVNAMVLGLGIDYGIHMITKVTSHVKEGKVEPDAISIAVSEFVRPALAALLTTVGAFSSMFFGMSKPFMQMGLFAIIGLSVFFVTMLLFLPSLLLVFKPSVKESATKQDLSFFFKGKVKGLIRIIALLIVVVFVPLGIVNLKNYWYTPSGLVSEKAESSIAFDEVKRSFQKVGFGEICVLADDLDDLKRVDSIIRNSGFLIPPLSVLNILEYASDDFVKSLPSMYSNLFQVVNNPVLVAVFKRVGMYSQILEMLSMVRNSKNLQDVLNELKKDVPMLFYEKDGKTKFVLYTDTAQDLYKQNRIKQVYNFFQKNNVKSYGYPAILYNVMNDMRGTIYWLSLFVTLGVFVMLLVTIRSIKVSMLIIGSVVISIVIAFGIGFTTKVHTTFMTLLLIPILVGTGVDGLIYMYHTSKLGDAEGLAKTLKSITFCTLTTVAAFGSFSLAEGKLLKEFGILMGIGLSISWLLTIFVVEYFFKGGDIVENRDVH
ncbi:MAG TPA: MMPL family transporter [Pseudothermotoga sp.]|nr:MMPL family transporter [Pseudothermotoga sp.]